MGARVLLVLLFAALSVAQVPPQPTAAASPLNGSYVGAPLRALWRYSDCKCGKRHLRSRMSRDRIVGGRDARKGEFPWWAIIYSRGQFLCSAVHVNSASFVTAAHCVFRYVKTPWDLKVRIGILTERDDSGPSYNVGRVLLPRQFVHGAKPMQYDVAVIRLTQHIDLTYYYRQSLLSPVCFAQETQSFVGLRAEVCGWGSTRYGGTYLKRLQAVDVTIISHDQCLQYYETSLASTAFCAGDPYQRKDACQGDSGGPLTVEGVESRKFLAGIVVDGAGCGRPDKPGIYTEISRVRPFLQQVFNKYADRDNWCR